MSADDSDCDRFADLEAEEADEDELAPVVGVNAFDWAVVCGWYIYTCIEHLIEFTWLHMYACLW